MIILTIRTDRPEAELGLFDDHKKLCYEQWTADRQLAETIHEKMKTLLDTAHKTLNHIDAVVVYGGPGSFTGLRIGITVANTLADSLKLPIIAAKSANWLTEGIQGVINGTNDRMVIPDYGALPHITLPKK